MLDAKTREIISITEDYTHDDDTHDLMKTEITYRAEEPELVKTFLEYDNQTENMRNITINSDLTIYVKWAE